MGSAYSYQTKNGLRWEARYRRPDGRPTRRGGFRRKMDAVAFINEVETAVNKGTYVSVSDGNVTVGKLGEDWLLAHAAAVKPSTWHSDESSWRVHVAPRWGLRKINTIQHTEIRKWVAELSARRSATTVKRAHGILAAILDGAVRDRRILANRPGR